MHLAAPEARFGEALVSKGLSLNIIQKPQLISIAMIKIKQAQSFISIIFAALYDPFSSVTSKED
jgi:hypothetical protein